MLTSRDGTMQRMFFVVVVVLGIFLWVFYMSSFAVTQKVITPFYVDS